MQSVNFTEVMLPKCKVDDITREAFEEYGYLLDALLTLGWTIKPPTGELPDVEEVKENMARKRTRASEAKMKEEQEYEEEGDEAEEEVQEVKPSVRVKVEKE